MKTLVCTVIFFTLLSCSAKKEYFTADLKFKGQSIEFFDTLSTVLITSNSADLGGKNSTFEELFGGGRVYKKNLPKCNGHFYIDSIERAQYSILLIEAFMMKDVLYFGFDRNVDFSNVTKDTIELEVWMQPGMTINN